MATVKGVYRTKADNPDGANIIEPGRDRAGLNVVYDEFTFAANPIGDVVLLGSKLPKGAIVHGIRIFNAALGVGVNLEVGDSNNTARYQAAYAVAAVGDRWAADIGGFGYKVGTNAGDDQIQAKTSGGAATGKISVAIFYAHGT